MAEAEEEKKEDGGVTSPEGILMLCVAGLLDVLSLIPVINDIVDILGVVIIGGWIVVTGRTEQLKKDIPRVIATIAIEAIPVVSALPSWTYFVWKVLNGKGSLPIK